MKELDIVISHRKEGTKIYDRKVSYVTCWTRTSIQNIRPEWKLLLEELDQERHMAWRQRQAWTKTWRLFFFFFYVLGSRPVSQNIFQVSYDHRS